MVRRLPLAAWACAGIAFANGALWATITPPLQIPDETAHYSYVQFLAEWGKLPGPEVAAEGDASQEVALGAAALPWSIEGRPNWRPDPLRAYRRNPEGLSRKSGTVPSATVNQPPLYYAVQAVPERIARSADLFDRLFVLRLVSALMAAITVMCTWLLVRELLPRPPWAATVGALAVAFQPMFGYMSGGVNNDNLLYTLGALLIYLVARALRRGLTWPLALALALVAAAGMVTKTSFAGLLPGAAVGVLLGIWRMKPPARRRALGAAAAGGLLFAGGVAGWLYANEAVFDRSATTTTGGFTGGHIVNRTTLAGHLSYVWQAFLPRLPGMQEFEQVSHVYPLWDVYVQGFIGRFGWWQFGFPMWVNWVGLVVFVGLAALAATALARKRDALRRGWPELLTFALVVAGLVVLVEVAAYRYQVDTSTSFEQARYLLPLVSLYGLVVALATHGFGRRWASAVGAVLVVLAIAHSLFAMLVVVGHYYG